MSRPDLARDTYLSSVHRIGLDGTVDQWTRGEHDTAPTISPDGRWVAFRRADGEAGPRSYPQLWLIPADGGEAKRLTELPLGIGQPVWSPDSTRLALTARIPEAGRYGAASELSGGAVAAEAEAPRRITRMDYRADDLGYRRDRPNQLFVLDALTAMRSTEIRELEPLTDRNTDVADPAWCPDGTTVLVVAARDWGAKESLYTDIYAVDTDSGTSELAVRSEGTASKPAVASDGAVYFLGSAFTGSDNAARNIGLWCAELAAGYVPCVPRRLTDVESVHCDNDAGAPVPFGDRILIAAYNRGAVELRSVPRSGDLVHLDSLDLVLGENGAVRGFTVDGDRIAAVVATPASIGEVIVRESHRELAPTDFGKPLREAGICSIRELKATAADSYPVHGWLALPRGPGPHPVVLAVHGGPFEAYQLGLFDEAQVYASAGYAVVLPNPRGSAGYGQQHGRVIVGRLGTVDADDILALLDAALARPDLDETKVGVMGGSYGGFMTTWLAAHHGERFRAAWSERAVNAWDSFTGSSDCGWTFTDSYVNSDPVVQREQSPLSYSEKIDIPFAVVHSEQDLRTPIEQAQRLFVALRRNGVDAELLIFPGEGHELSRGGRPRHREQRFEAVLEWWGRHLG